MVESLPQIKNKAQMEEALSGSETLYAVLDAPVSGSPAEDIFDILNMDCLYILYRGESIQSSVYYEDGLGAQTIYQWESNGEVLERYSKEICLYEDVQVRRL